MKFLPRVMAIIEMGTGLALMAVPSLVVMLLLGSPIDSLPAITLGRVAGAALFALGLACWSAQGMAVPMLFYNGIVALLLAWSGISTGLVGVALWPAVILHVILGIACLVALRLKSSAKPLVSSL